MDSIIIEVKGGVVQEVRSTNPTIGVTLVDWDNIEQGDLPEEYGVEPLTPSDTLLFLGVEGATKKMGEWFASQGQEMPPPQEPI